MLFKNERGRAFAYLVVIAGYVGDWHGDVIAVSRRKIEDRIRNLFNVFIQSCVGEKSRASLPSSDVENGKNG